MTRCCEDIAIHNHGSQTYRNGQPYAWRHAFEWRRPLARVYPAAERRRFAIGLNRYPGVVIGIGLQLGSRVLSIVWGRPGRIIEIASLKGVTVPGTHRARERPLALVASIGAALLALVTAIALSGHPAAPVASTTGSSVADECQAALGYPARTSADRTWLRQCVHALTPPTVAPTSTGTPSPSPTATVPPTTPPATTPPATTPPATTPPATATPPATTVPPTTTPPAAAGCVPNPHLCGYPDATNTGVLPGSLLLVHAGNYYATAGESITNLEITGCLYVGGANVHVTNSKINTGNQCYYAVRNGVVPSEGDWAGLVITDTEIRMSALAGAYGISYDNYTVDRVRFTNAPGNPGADCMYAGRNVIIRNSYCQIGLYQGDNFAAGAPHFDAVSSSGGDGILIDHNTLLNPNPQNSAILLSTNDSPIANVTINDNLVSGGNYTVYCGTDSGGNTTGTMVFTNNRFARGQYRFGPTTHCASASPHTGNVFDDDGTPIPVS